MKSRLLKILSGLMFVVFLAGVMPREYLHDIVYDHHDDVHPVYKKGEIVFTNKHHHCSFLNFEFAPFLVAEQPFFSFRHFINHTTYVVSARYFHYATLFHVHSLRGPPIYNT